MAGKSYIKVGTYDWDRIKKMYIKTGGQTWSAVRKSYVKTSTGWRKVFDTASNRPFIAGNDIPKIRLNTFRTGSTYNPTGTLDDPVDPLVEAPPVQQMGPTWTSPTYGWPYESLGRHLWGYDGTWTSGNGSSMTFTYTWLYNLTGNSNNNTPEYNATSSTGRTDMLTNLSAYLGQNDGDYFDKNFLTFRVTATNSAGNASAESAPVYIVREVPTGSITMVSPGTAFTNSSMSATFTYSNNWYNKTDVSNSYIEWFAVSNLGDALTSNNRVEIQNLSSIAVTGTTSKSGTTSHVPTLANKYYYVKMTLNNSGTQNAVIAINGFTPKSSVTSQSNKTVVTSAALIAPTSTSISSVSRLNDTTIRAVIDSSGGGGPYYQQFWTTASSAPDPENRYDAASITSTVTEDYSFSAGYTYYFYIRSSSENLGNTTTNGTGTAGTYSAYGPSTGAASYTFVSPSGATSSVSGSSTVGSTLTLTANSPTSAAPAASTTSIVWRVNDGGTSGSSFTAGSVLQNGGTTFVIPQYLYGSVSSVGYSIRAEVTWNNGVGSQIANSTATVVTAAGVAPSGGGVTLTPTGTQMAGVVISANVTAMSGTTPITYITTIRKATGYSPTGSDTATTPRTGLTNPGTGTGNAVAQHEITTGEASGTPDQFKAYTVGSNAYGSFTVGSNTVISTPYVAPVVAPADGTATVDPTTGTAGTTTYTGSTSGWTGSAATYTYSWQYFSQSSFSYVQYTSGTSFSPPANINTLYPNYGWRLLVTATNTAGSATAAAYPTVNSPAVVTIPSVPTNVTVSGSGVVSWDAMSGATSYEVLNYTDRTGSPANTTNRLGPYTTTGITGTSFQLTSTQGYSGSNNYARAQVRARNSAGVSSYSAWYPSSTTYV